MRAMETPVLRTQRLYLRRYRPEDLDFFSALFGDHVVMAHSSTGRLTAPRAKTLFDKVFGVYRDGLFAVWCVMAGQVHVGHAELKPRKGEDGLELVYFLAARHWKKGYGTELVGRLAAHGFTEAERLIATVDPANAASIRVLQKNGFRFVDADRSEAAFNLYEKRKEWA
jgi:ribosomal-protein-alanine N-acetyltransferase